MRTSHSPFVASPRLRRAPPDRRAGADASAGRALPRRTTRSPRTSACSANTSSAASRRPPASPPCRAASTGAHSSGFYLGTWASNISWLEDFGAYTRSSLEWDFYGGYKGTISDDWNYDLGTIYYYYPGSRNPGVVNANTWEIYAALNWKWLGAKASYSLDNYFGAQPTGQKTDGTWYFDFYANYPVGETGFTLIGHFGILNVAHDGSGSTQGLVQRLEARRFVRGRRRPAEGLRSRRVLQRQQRQEGVLHRPHRLQHREGRRRRLRQEDVLKRGPPFTRQPLTRGDHETRHRNHQAVQARRGPRGPVGNRRAGRHRHRGQGLRPAEGPHRALSRRRIRRRFPAEGEDRSRDQERACSTA